MTGGAVVGLVGGLALLAGCGTAAAGAPVAVGCRSGTVTLTAGQQLRVGGCAPGVRAAATGGALSAVGPFTFRASHAGAARVELDQGAVCPSGTICPQYLIHVGLITVTVR